MSTTKESVRSVETGIKGVDLFARLPEGGIATFSAIPGVGCLVMISEIIHNLDRPTVAVGMEEHTHDVADFANMWRDVGLDKRVASSLVERGASDESRRATIERALASLEGSAGVMVLDATAIAGDDDPTWLLEMQRRVAKISTILVLEVLGADDSPRPELAAVSVARLRFSPELARRDIWPALDPVLSASDLVVAGEHTEVLDAARTALTCAGDARDRIERYLSQPFFVAEIWSGLMGVRVDAADAVADVRRLLETPEDWALERLYMQGRLDALANVVNYPLRG